MRARVRRNPVTPELFDRRLRISEDTGDRPANTWPEWSAHRDPHAAVARDRVEPRRETVGHPKAFEDTSQEVEVHPADELTLLVRQPVKRAVGQGDLVGPAGRLVAVGLEHAAHLGAPAPVGPLLVGPVHLPTDPAAGVLGDGADGINAQFPDRFYGS